MDKKTVSVDEKRVRAMISLLDDPDDSVFRQVQSELYQLGENIIPELQRHWEETEDAFLQSRIEQTLHQIQYRVFLSELQDWSTQKDPDLLKGLIIINRYQYPGSSEQAIENKVEEIKREIWLQMIYKMSPLENVRLINNVLFYSLGFSSNIKRYYDPDNSYISQVLESKKGNPVLLASLYCVIARRLKMPVAGINLPKHFILAYTDDYQTNKSENEVLFYINPFNKGQIFGKHDVLSFLRQINVKPSPQYYKPCTNIDIIIRILQNLIFAYSKLNQEEKSSELQRALALVESSAS